LTGMPGRLVNAKNAVIT